MTKTHNGGDRLSRDGEVKRHLVFENCEIVFYMAIIATLVVLMVFVEILHRIVRSKGGEEQRVRRSRSIDNRGPKLAVHSPRARTP
jgi:hypothetical protein